MPISVESAPDGQLLQRFVAWRDEEARAAFAALIDRHEPMVLSVCRRMLSNPHDAEDATQATFLVLARQARSIRRCDSVGSWLFGVACRIARRAKVDAARRRKYERRGAEMAARWVDDPGDAESWPELYEEIGRLPQKCREPIVLCYLVGCTQDEAARQLRCPVRTLQNRLARGRELLRIRLTRRGFGPVAGMLTTTHWCPAVTTAPTPAWVEATARTAERIAADRLIAAVAPPRVARLTAEMLRSLLIDKLWSSAAVAMVLASAIWTASIVREWAASSHGEGGDSAAPTAWARVRGRITSGTGRPLTAGRIGFRPLGSRRESPMARSAEIGRDGSYDVMAPVGPDIVEISGPRFFASIGFEVRDGTNVRDIAVPIP
jgi:RNA polymerase sigma factor (sigma-70 family)